MIICEQQATQPQQVQASNQQQMRPQQMKQQHQQPTTCLAGKTNGKMCTTPQNRKGICDDRGQCIETK